MMILNTRVRLKDHWLEQRIFLRRTLGLTALIAVSMLFVIGRLFELQVLNFEHFSDLSRGNRIRIEPLPPTRGLIFDRNGKVLAENLPSYQLAITPEEVPDMDDTMGRLAEFGFVEEGQLPRIRELLRKKRRFEAVPVSYRLSDDEVARFSVQRHRFPGVDIRARLTRYYPLGPSAVHAVGYVGGISEREMQHLDFAAYAGTTHMGKVGVELEYEHLLHGSVGHRQVKVNAQGRRLDELTSETKDPVPGQDLYLSLDIEAQQAAEKALEGRRGAVVALDPNNGDVLVFASTPSFDPNPFGAGLSVDSYQALQTDPDKPLFNRALRGQYPPGSTIKPMIALAGLDYGALMPGHRVYCPGYFTLPNNPHRFRDWRKQGHGLVDLHESIVRSCDVYFYQLALVLGIDRMHDFMSRFGFGHLTGIDIPGEKSGLMPSREWKRGAFAAPADQVWFPGETVITGIGQGFTLSTPLQLAHATAILASRGQRYEPRLVTAVRNSITGDITELPPVNMDPLKVASEELWDQIQTSMSEVVHAPNGTARRIAQDAAYRIAGKTGTAQVFTVAQADEYDETQVEERLRHHALFIAYAPAEQPRIALAVIVENGGSGSRSAAPVARAVLDSFINDDNARLAKQ